MKKKTRVWIASGLTLLLLGGFLGCRKDTSKTSGDPTGLPEGTVTPTAGADDLTPEMEPTKEAEPTGEVTKTPEGQVTVTPEGTLTPVPTATPVPEDQKPRITQEQALQTVQMAVSDKKYVIEAGAEPMFAEGKEYFVFSVLEKGSYLEPVLLVDKEDGSLHYYDKGGTISAFTKFPLDNVETVTGGDGQLTEQEALEKLSGFNADTLKLSKSFEKYDTEIDSWTTIVNGEECYGINVFDPEQEGRPLAGIYYVALDGTAVYTVDEDYNFILLN